MATSNRKRSSRACASCRSRKVRCDMETFGSPCTNCLLNEAHCQPATNVRKMRCPTILRQRERTVHREDHCQSPRPPKIDHGVVERQTAPSEEPSTVPEANFNRTESSSLLPPFVETPKLAKDDLSYLRRKGALDIPEWGLMTELLTSYCNWIHPQLPMLDLKRLLETIFGIQKQKLSLLLFQAVLFAGAAFVDEEILMVHGYDSKLQAQDQLFQRVKLLYQAEYEEDALILAQAALLLSINHRCSKSASVWVAQSHVVAQNLGLERILSHVSMSTQTSNACKRLWWCIFVRDSILHLELGTPKRFRGTSEDNLPLTAECFDVTAFSERVQSALPDAAFVQDCDFRQQVARLAVKRARLVTFLSPIQSITSIDSGSLAPRSQAALNYLRKGLQTWRTEVEGEMTDAGSSHVASYHYGLLQILYLATQATMLQRCSRPVSSEIESQLHSRTSQVLRIATNLYAAGSSFCATSGMGTIYNFTTTAVGLAERASSEADLRDLENAAVCLKGLQATCPRGSVIEFALQQTQTRLERLMPQTDAQSQHGSYQSDTFTETSIQTPGSSSALGWSPDVLEEFDDGNNEAFEEYFEMLIDSEAGGKMPEPPEPPICTDETATRVE